MYPGYIRMFQDWKIDAHTVLEDCEKFSCRFNAPYDRNKHSEYFGIDLPADETKGRAILAANAMAMLEAAQPSRTFADIHGLDVSRYIALCVSAGREACEAQFFRACANLEEAKEEVKK